MRRQDTGTTGLLQRTGKDPDTDVKWLRLEIARQKARIDSAVASDAARPDVYFEGYGRHTDWFVEETEAVIRSLERRRELLATRKPPSRAVDPTRRRFVEPASMRDPGFDPFS